MAIIYLSVVYNSIQLLFSMLKTLPQPSIPLRYPYTYLRTLQTNMRCRYCIFLSKIILINCYINMINHQLFCQPLIFWANKASLRDWSFLSRVTLTHNLKSFQPLRIFGGVISFREGHKGYDWTQEDSVWRLSIGCGGSLNLPVFYGCINNRIILNTWASVTSRFWCATAVTNSMKKISRPSGASRGANTPPSLPSNTPWKTHQWKRKKFLAKRWNRSQTPHFKLPPIRSDIIILCILPNHPFHC